MANNRMYLRCDSCGEQKLLAKYYPSTSWYFAGDSYNRDEWLEIHSHEDGSPLGPTHFRLVYETVDQEENEE